jgi:Photosystem II 12 kDa extrinsic protein (PsbU)
MKAINLAVLNLILLATGHAFTASLNAQGSLTSTARTPVLFAQSFHSFDRRGALVSLASLPFLRPGQALAVSSGARIDVNNALAREYTAFPGLFPTVATKIVQNAPYKSKKEVYAVLNELEADRLKVNRQCCNFMLYPGS